MMKVVFFSYLCTTIEKLTNESVKMVQLPEEFLRQTRLTMGDELFERYLKAFEEEPPVSIRVNGAVADSSMVGEAVPWCRNGYYLPNRPAFTFDPLLHAGCYYVQEASSMFLDHVFSTLLTQRKSSTSALPRAANLPFF